MKVEDMGLGLSPQGVNSNSLLSAKNNKRVLIFNFISLGQLNSQKLRIFGIIAAFFAFFQTSFISFWPHLNLSKLKFENKYDYIRIPPSYEENLTNVFFLYSNNRSPKDLYLFSFIIFFIAFFLFIISLITLCVFYFKNLVNFQLLYCYNFFIQFICPVIPIPLGFQIGWLISKVRYMKELESEGIPTDSFGSIDVFIAIIVLDLILYILIISVIILTNLLNSNSIIIVDSYFVSYNGAFQSCLMLIPSVILLLSNVLPLFRGSLVHLIMTVHAIFCVCMTVWPFWLPYGQIKMNAVVSASFFSMLVSDIICYTKWNTKWYRYPLFFGCLIVSYIIINFFIKLRVKFVLKTSKNKDKEKEKERLDESNEFEKPSLKPGSIKEQGYQLFGDPSVETGFENMPVSKLFFILRVAISTKSSIFLDGKLVDLITQKADSNQDKIQLGRLICYFPDFQSIYFAIITGLKRARYLPFIQEFLLYQLRYHEICSNPESKIEDVEDLIENSLALSIHIRSFWQIIDSECRSYTEEEEVKRNEKGTENNINKNNSKKSIDDNYDYDTLNEKVKLKAKLFSSFDRLSRSVYNIESKWKTLISFYPNNIQIIDEYVKFLIECNGDFVGASEWKTVSSLIKEGKTYKFNPVHVSFLRAFPSYTKDIFPKKSLIRGFDDIDIHSKIDNVGKLIEMPEVRLELQRSVTSSYPFSIFVFLFISIISLAFILVFWTYCICSFGHFEHIYDSLYFINNTTTLAQQISINFISAILDYGRQQPYNVTPSSDEIFNLIYNGNESDRVDKRSDKSLVMLNDNYKPQIANSCEKAIDILNYLHRESLSQIEKGNNFQVVMDILFERHATSTNYYNTNDSINSTSSLQSLLISHFIYYHTMSYDTNYTAINDTECYHATMAGSYVIDRLDEVSQSVLSNNQFILKDKDTLYSTKLYIVSACYIVISCIFVWIDFIFIMKNFQSITNSLCNFPKNVKIKASQSILMISTSPNTSTSTTEKENEFMNIDDSMIISIESKVRNFVIISLIFATIINLGIAAAIFSFHFIYTKYRYNFVSISELYHYYSLETSQIIEVLHSVMAAATFEIIVPSVGKKYRQILSNALKNVILTHQRCWGYSVRGDCGISNEYVLDINRLKNMEKCPDWRDKTYHELYGCLSEESAFNAFIDLTNTLKELVNNDFLLKTETFKQYVHFVLGHLYFDVQKFGDYLMLGFVDLQTDYSNHIQTFGAISIIAACLIFILNFYIFIKIKGIFKLLFAFISRVLPSDLILNNRLMNALLGIKSNNKAIIENGETSFLVQESKSPIIFLDRAGLIEFVNSAFSHKFSYEANFIVGQPISVLIDDESALFFIDTLKFFESKKTTVKTIYCKKGNGNKALFDISFIPIHNSSTKDKSGKNSNENQQEIEGSDDEDAEVDDANNNNINNVNANANNVATTNNNNNSNNTKNSFVNRIALVFIDRTTERNLEKRCNAMKITTNKIASVIFPLSFQLYCEGYLKMCSICIIKFSNSFQQKASSSRVLNQRQTMYDLLFEKLKIYPLLVPLDCKNGIFVACGCKKNDPAELAIECLNYAFNIVDQFDDQLSKGSPSIKATGPFFAVIETGGELTVGWTGDSEKKTVITGELMERALKVLDNASLAGTICVSNKTYEYLMQHDYSFIEREIPEEICGCKAIYAIENNRYDYSAYMHSKSDHSEYESKNSSNSMSFIEKMKEDDANPFSTDSD